MAAEEQEATLERLLTRLALTDDSKLEPVLAKILPYAISCLGAPQSRQKVMEILTHINRRVKDVPSIKLPLLELLELYQNEMSEPIIKNFALVYLEMSFDRHPKDDLDVMPELLKNLYQISSQQQDILLRMFAKSLEKYAFKTLEENAAARFAFLQNPQDRDIFVEFCLQTIIYQPSTKVMGLSKLQVSRVSGKDMLKGEALMNRKMSMLNLMSELKLSTEILYPLLLVASVDSNETVSKRGEELLKKTAGGVNFENQILISKLFSMFQGTIGNNIADDAKVSPASSFVKEKIMNLFTRSIKAANAFPATLHCIFHCIFGTESYPRLKQLGMEFAIWVFKHARDEQLKPMAPIILSGILKLLDSPPPDENNSSSKQLRMFAYQSVGQLGKRAPYLFRDNLGLVRRLFEAFKLESFYLKLTIQEALVSLASAYADCSELLSKEIMELLLTSASAVEGEARFCSVWWAKSLFPFTECASRFICMLGASDERLDVRDMALEGLLLEDQNQAEKAHYPLLSDMLDFICKQQPGLQSRSKLAEQELFFESRTYEAMIIFLLNCHDDDKSDHMFEERLLLLLEHAMVSNGSIALHMQASNGLLKVASRAPERFAKFYADRIPWLRQYIGHIDGSVRQRMAKLLGIAVSELTTSKAVDLLGELMEIFALKNRNRFEDMQGSICATGYIFAQCSTGVPRVPTEMLEMTISNLLQVGNSGTPELTGAVVEAIGHIGLRASLQSGLKSMTIKTQIQETHEVFSSETKVGSERTLFASVIKLLNDMISSKDTKVVQKAVIAYGHLCFGNPDEDLAQEALNALLGLCRSKVEDILFCVGEALSFIWGNVPVTPLEILRTTYVSLSTASNFLNDDGVAIDHGKEMTHSTSDSWEKRSKARETIVQKLFDNLLYSSRKEERCAGAVWLVSIITYCQNDPRVHQLLPDIQEAFSHLLGDQNDLTQEMASKGLSIVYDLGDVESKHELVKALVSTLSGMPKKKRAIKLTEDSEIFEEGTLGEKPGGGSITTYKELCSLANEMGQPDLIYKFMDLANHQASLNSKRGAAFGFARIAKQSREALLPYLPSLVPKLVRYQYDPNRSVQDAMGHIWRSLVPEPKKTVDELFEVIIKDLLVQAGSRLWRARESSCLALADIIQGRKFEEVEKYLEKIWVICLRAMDDVKETVRISGVSLSRSISALTIRLSDSQLTNESEARSTLKLVMPVLLSKGISSQTPDVQRLSINTVTKLAKNAGSSVRPQLPELIVCMLESLSSLEDQRLNYAELHAETAGISIEKFESLRVAMSRDSPMWETLHFCLQQVDEQVMEVLVPCLVQLVRSGVGLNTRVGVAKFISLLTQQQGPEIHKYAGILLKVLKEASQEEKSSSSRHAFVSACASIAKYANNTQIQSLFEDTITLCNENNLNAKITSALMLKELSHQAHDVFLGYNALVLPTAFIARFDEDKTVCDLFEDIWNENTSGQSIAMELYLSEIVSLALRGLTDTSWKQKKKCALAVTQLVEARHLTALPVQPLLTALIDELSNRVWEGKEVLLDALSAICKNYSSAIDASSDPNTVKWQTVISTVLAACTKKQVNYRNAAFSCLEKVLVHCKQEVFKDEAFTFVLQCCSNTKKEKLNDEDEGDRGYALSLEKVLKCLKASITGVSVSFIGSRFEAITACLAEKLNGSYNWQVKVAALETVQTLVDLVLKSNQRERTQMHIEEGIEILFPAILECAISIKVGQVRVKCLECMLTILGDADNEVRPGLLQRFGEEASERLALLMQLEPNDSTKSLIQSVLALLTALD